MVQYEVDDFVSLARSGAYMGGNRQVSPRERSRWRFTFKRLADEAQDALRAEDAGPAASALEQLIDLACEAHDYDYFRSDDPVAAAGSRVRRRCRVVGMDMGTPRVPGVR